MIEAVTAFSNACSASVRAGRCQPTGSIILQVGPLCDDAVVLSVDCYPHIAILFKNFTIAMIISLVAMW